MSFLLRNRLLLLAVSLPLIGAIACSSDNQSTEKAGAGQVAAPVPTPTMVEAVGWTDLKMVANYAQTEMDHMAHFHTSRNACGREEFGALELELWNQFATAANTAVAQPPLTNEYCLPAPEMRNKVFDGTAELKLSTGGNRPIFDARGNEICTTIADRAAAGQLLNAIHELVKIADLEGCPLGY